jgi:hypothetical protein
MTAYAMQSGTYDGLYQKRSLDGTQVSKVIDWSKLASGAAAATTSDTATIIDLPKDFVATHAFVRSIVACTTASYFTMSPFLSATVTASNAAGTITTVALATPVAYTAATLAVITPLGTAPHNGKSLITICGYQLETV